ncbi:hypothetical protein LIG30_4468 [Burkholderia sp. lig30]|uniref:alpha/beta hydrolase family protein n=1 Tax=Burkholderia sp. lig30 TaxID=1192124 RepID=UPI0004616E96|nr:esterase [Burkholderia sp. lig30]KDB06080.1 hypothetical protein LIG30_4468 [Burkholderia sp. lig30]
MSTTIRNASLSLLTCLTLCASVNVQAGSACDESECASRGRLVEQQTTLRLSAAALTKLLDSSASGRQLEQIAGVPSCNVQIVYFRYRTIGGAGEPATSGAALMIPGGGPACTGRRPVLLYAHATTAYRNYNIADVTQTDPANVDGASEGIGIAAIYAAHGYIVVASNYAGYAGSDLTYHPYLNADQQSADMIDSLRAMPAVLRRANPEHTTRGSGKLFVTGYSQGGHVALATQRALQRSGFLVTASAPGSGPYALAASGDAIIEGEVSLGAPVFVTLVATSYQRAYRNIYQTPGDMYEASYAPGIENLLPNLNPLGVLFASGKLPPTQLFSSTPPAPQFASLTPPIVPPLVPAALTPLFTLGFGTANLVRNAYRLSALEDAFANPDGAFPNPTAAMAPATHPTHPLRRAFRRNDLRNWVPRSPVLLCGGNADPTVFFFNTLVEQAYWLNANVRPGLTTVLDVDSSISGPHDAYAAVKQGFALAKVTLAAQAVAAGAKDGGAAAVLQAYHADLVAPFCMSAARAFFSHF